MGQTVIGVVTQRHAEQFTVDIGTGKQCVLPSLSFEGATKRNIPNVHPGDVIFAKIYSNIPNTEVILTCVKRNNKSDGLGKLNETGFIFQVSPEVCKM